jgi:hypothetical protein
MDGVDASFLRMDRDSYHRSIFLDARAAPLDPKPQRRPLALLLDEARDLPPPPPLAWIFHIAHCGSTLLARAIDLPGSDLVLREPPPLRQIAIESATARHSKRWSEKLALAHRFAARRFDQDEPVIVKANVPVNFILHDLLALGRSAPAILLHMPLEAYLLAILRDADHRTWVDRISGQLQPALCEGIDGVGMTDSVERATGLWLAQILAFSDVLAQHPSARSLDAELLFTDPISTVDSVLEHFGIAARPARTDLDLLLSRYSKNPAQPFNEAERRGRQETDRVRLADELKQARRWIEQAPVAARLPRALDRPLSGDPTQLL